MILVDELSLQMIERENAQGLTSREILDLCRVHEISLSEATLRKYVQLGLLPRSVRVGQKGKHRGSRGVYPVHVIRQLVLIKQLMASDYTIEQIQEEFLFLRGELEQLEVTLRGILSKLTRALSSERGRASSTMSREVSAAQRVGRDLMTRLRTLESEMLPSIGQGSVSPPPVLLQGVAG